MSLLASIIGGGLTGLGTGLVKETEKEDARLAKKQEMAENERLYNRSRKDRLADERRLLGRQAVGEPQYDPSTQTMTTFFADGSSKPRPASKAEIRAYERSEREFAMNEERHRSLIGMHTAQTEAMRRGGSGGSGGSGTPRKLAEWEVEAMARDSVGPEPDRAMSPEEHATWTAAFNRAKVAIIGGMAPPSPHNRRIVKPQQAVPVSLPRGAPGGPEDAAKSIIRNALPALPNQAR